MSYEIAKNGDSHNLLILDLRDNDATVSIQDASLIIPYGWILVFADGVFVEVLSPTDFYNSYELYTKTQKDPCLDNKNPDVFLKTVNYFDDHFAGSLQELLSEKYHKGVEKYGIGLKPFNGRDACADLLDELLDAVNYLQQWIEEEKTVNHVNAQVLAMKQKELVAFTKSIHAIEHIKKTKFAQLKPKG